MKKEKKAKRNKKHVGPRFRDHTAVEKTYIFLYEKFDKACEVATMISLNQHGIDTDGRGIRGANIFTRQLQTAYSLKRILPVLRTGSDPEVGFWDVATIALVARSLMENFQALYFYGTEAVSEIEADFRFHIFQKDRNTKWRDIKLKMGVPAEEIAELIAGVPEQKERILNHEFYKTLAKEKQSNLKNRAEMYYTKGDFEARCPRLAGIEAHYQLLSNLAHPLPLAIERMDGIRGRGEAVDADVSLVNLCLYVASDCLIASIEEMGAKFADTLGIAFRHLIQQLAEYPECE